VEVDSSPIVVFVGGSIYFLKEVGSPFPTPMPTVTAIIVSPVMVLSVFH